MSNAHEITLNGARIDWDLDTGNMRFFGIPGVLFWLNPSLYRMLKPLVEVCGVQMYRLLVAHESSLGTEADYHAMVTQLGETFAEGFLAWGAAVSAASWGRIELPELDMEAKHARVKIHNPWELKMLRETGERWGCPFMQGKIIGVFSHAFGLNCWADEERVVDTEDELSVEFRVYPAERTISGELERLREQSRDEHERRMQSQVESATRQLQDKLELVERQRQVIRKLSTPLIQVWEGVLVLPLVGPIDDERADELTARTLEAVSTRKARYVLLDLTGVSDFSLEVANHLLRTVGAVQLLGARCLLSGVSPKIAQTLIGVGTRLSEVPAFATVQVALEQVIGRG